MDDLPKVLVLLLTLAAFLPHASGEIPRREVESATAALRSKGYNLFGNSLTVSDILFQVLSGEEFTFLSPPDTSLFSLGMSIDSFRYVHSLRLHVIPRRLSISDLRNLSLSSSPSAVTLVPSHSLFLANRRRNLTSGDSSAPGTRTSGAFDYVVVNGIRISSPDIYLGPNIAVHGLDGTLAADMLPPETFQGDQGLSFSPPPSWPPSEIPAPWPSTGPYPDPIPPPVSPWIDVYPPDFKGSPIFPSGIPAPLPSTIPYPGSIPPPVSQSIDVYSPDFKGSTIFQYPNGPNLPPPTPRVPSPVTDTFSNSPQSVNLAPGSSTPVGPPPSVSMPPPIAVIPSPWDDESSSRETGQVQTGFRPNPNPNPESSSPSVELPPRQAPPNPPPRIWGTAPPPPYQNVWKNYPSQPWRKPKESRESTKDKKSNKKHKRSKGHHHRHHRKHKGL